MNSPSCPFAVVHRSRMALRCVRRDAPFRTQLDNNGQRAALGLNKYAAFDPTRTSTARPATCVGNPWGCGSMPHSKRGKHTMERVSMATGETPLSAIVYAVPDLIGEMSG